MKLAIKPLLVTTVIGCLFIYLSEVQAEQTLIDLTFEAQEAGQPPTTESFQMDSVNHALESASTIDSNRLEVVKDAPNFPGKSLRFIKGSDEPRTPTAVLVNKPDLLTSGKVRFTWEASLDSFTPSEKFPGFEALLTFVLMDRFGKPVFNFYYLVGKDQESGSFGYGDQKSDTWHLGEKHAFEVTLDLDKNSASLKIDGADVASDISVPATGGLRVVQFSDGAGLAFYGSRFTATIGNFKMTQL